MNEDKGTQQYQTLYNTVALVMVLAVTAVALLGLTALGLLLLNVIRTLLAL